MTVTELIEKLKTFPPDTIVVYPTGELYCLPIVKVESKLSDFQNGDYFCEDDLEKYPPSNPIQVILIYGENQYY